MLYQPFVELILLKLKTKSHGKCTEIVSKTTKTTNFLTVLGEFEAFSIYQLKLSRDESSQKKHCCPCFRRLTILDLEVYRYFDEN